MSELHLCHDSASSQQHTLTPDKALSHRRLEVAREGGQRRQLVLEHVDEWVVVATWIVAALAYVLWQRVVCKHDAIKVKYEWLDGLGKIASQYLKYRN